MNQQIKLDSLGCSVGVSAFPQHEWSSYDVLMKAWTEFRSRFAWSHFSTLTFAHRTDRHQAEKRFARFVRRLEWHSRNRVEYLGAMEIGLLGRLHIHALLSGTGELPLTILSDQWKQRRVDISPFNPDDNASYPLKTLPWENSELLIRAPRIE